MKGACDGLRVIDFSWWMAGPLATMVLADNGADVIKVEPPAGDPARDLPAFQTWNRAKRSAVLDLKTPAGRAGAIELARTADVVLTAFRPGVAERLGIGYEQLRDANPALVYAAISGYGAGGSRRDIQGYEALVAAKTGRMTMFEGIAERKGPAYPALPCASFSAAMLAVQGILAALRTRRETGRGQQVSVSLAAALLPYDMIAWIAPQIAALDAETAGKAAGKGMYNAPKTAAPDPEPDAGDSSGDAGKTYDSRRVHRPDFRVPRPNYLPAVTKDGVWLQFANTADHLWLAQMQALDLVGLYAEERFAKMPSVATEGDSEALWEVVLERVRTKTYEEWARIFDEHQNVAVDRFLTPLEAVEHRQVRHNGHVVEVPGLDGTPTRQPGALARSSLTETSIGTRAPRLGEHTRQVLEEASTAPARAEGGSSKDGGASAGPLAGVTVVDFATFFAAPYATSILANLGARVIKIEPLDGDYSRFSAGGLLAFPTTQGKESIALDLKREEGRKIAHQLIERADLLLHNFRPGVTQRLGIDYETCRALNPRLTYLYGASYGDDGPDASRPAFHPIAGAIAGNAMRQVGAGHPLPDSAALPIDELKREAWRMMAANESNPDVNAALAAATVLLLGLHAREEGGAGEELMTTMIASNLYAGSDELIDYEGRPAPPAVDRDLYGIGPAYRLYETAEGWLFLACPRRVEWSAFCRAARVPELEASWEAAWAGGAQAGELASTLQTLFRSRTAAAWEAAMREHDVPLVAVESRTAGAFFLEDEDMREQGYAVRTESAVYGGYWRHGALQQFSGHDLTYGPWEGVGGHSRALLAELGYAAGEIEALIETGVVAAAEE